MKDGEPKVLERDIVIGMVRDAEILKHLAELRKDGEEMFASEAGKVVSSLCFDWWDSAEDGQKKAPKRHIENLFAVRYENHKPPEMAERFIQSIDWSRKVETGYILKACPKHVTGTRLRKAMESAATLLERGRGDQAVDLLTSFVKTDVPKLQGCHPFSDPGVIAKAFRTEQVENLIPFHGDLGKFLAGALGRGKFVSICAGEKIGKTMYCVDLSFRGMKNRKKVAYFQAGDQTEEEILRRFYSRAALHPTNSPEDAWPFVVEYPISASMDHGIDRKPLAFDFALNEKMARKGFDKVVRDVRSNESYFYLSAYPAGTLSIRAIESELDRLALSGWGRPDVVVIDYADILEDIEGDSFQKENKIDRINRAWIKMRKLSQSRNCLVITATQIKREGYDAGAILPKHMADDKRKLGHVTGMLGVSANEKDIELGASRLNWVRLRDKRVSPYWICVAAGCWELNYPTVRSFIQKKRKDDK